MFAAWLEGVGAVGPSSFRVEFDCENPKRFKWKPQTVHLDQERARHPAKGRSRPLRLFPGFQFGGSTHDLIFQPLHRLISRSTLVPVQVYVETRKLGWYRLNTKSRWIVKRPDGHLRYGEKIVAVKQNALCGKVVRDGQADKIGRASCRERV